MATCKEDFISVQVGRHLVRTYIRYLVIPGEKAALDNPPSDPEIEIKEIFALRFLTSSIDVFWFNDHLDWTEWLENVIENKLTDYDLPYIYELLGGAQ
jgi:hypothetical protein